MDQHVAAADVDLVFQSQGDGLRRDGLFHLALESVNGPDAAGLARGEGHDLVAGTDDAGGHAAAVAAEVGVRAVHVLDGEPEVDQVHVGRDVRVFQQVHQRAAGVPRHVRAFGHDVVPG